MSSVDEILGKLRGLNQKIVPCFSATVKSVEDFSCTVILPDGLELSGVRLKAGVDKATEYFKFKPRVKSTVLIALLGEDESAGEYYVASYNEIDEVELQIKDTSVLLNKDIVSASLKDSKFYLTKDNAFMVVGTDGNQSKITLSKTEILIEPKLRVTIKNASTNLGAILQDIATTLRDISIVTPAGVGTLRPDLIAKMQIAVQQINNIVL